MDRAKAEELGRRLIGRQLDGWTITNFVDAGKSAAVFRAARGEEIAAIKVYDDDLVSKYGDITLLERLSREKSLKNHGHPNLVAIHDSGFDAEANSHYLIMEYLDNRNLAETLSEVPREAIPVLVQQLASAAEFLAQRGLAHRDIKPANIVVVDDYSRLILLDFGVLKPVGEAGLTDQNGEPLFVGTNQYASPEFAMRNEEESDDGWKAVTFYQIGAVIHDLIMRRPLFADAVSVPARLAYAVQSEVPTVESNDVPPYLVRLARSCLVKAPKPRLSLVSWESFAPPAPNIDELESLKDRIRDRVASSSLRERERAAHNLGGEPSQTLGFDAEGLVKQVLQDGFEPEVALPRRVVFKHQGEPGHIAAVFEPSAEHGLPDGLALAIRVSVTDPTSSVVEVHGSAASGSLAEGWTPTFAEQVFVGVYVEAEVRAATLGFLLKEVEAAQERAVLSTPPQGG